MGPTKGLVADENALACRPGAFRALVRIGGSRHPAIARVEVLATRLVEGARSLRQAIEERESVVDELPWHELLGSVDRMHAAGVHHAQHPRLRGEFFLRSLWSWYGGTSWARWRAA